jgi:hypothetical protein
VNPAPLVKPALGAIGRLTVRLLLPALLLSAARADASPDTTAYFYRGLPYGSQANYNPLNVLVNGGYGILQVPSYPDHRVLSYHYREWWDCLWLHIGSPLHTIDRFGWGRFLSTEIFPTSLDIERQQFFPNYFLHALGAGMHYRATLEWYRSRGIDHPAAASLLTMAGYHLLSEMVENRDNREPSVDAIADLYFFDPLGIFLFSRPSVCRFFSRKLELAEWSGQPGFSFGRKELVNMGQFYVMKYPLTGDHRWKVFSHFGLNGLSGLSRRTGRGGYLSLGLGFSVKELTPAQQDQSGRALTARLAFRTGAFFDVSNSLMCSAVYSQVPENRLQVNLYPGLIGFRGFSPGFFACDRGSRGWAAGIKVDCLPVGAAF